MKKKVLFILLLSVVLTLQAHVKNPDKPQKGEWDFKLKTVYEIEKAGEEVLARPGGILIAGNGNLIVHDGQRRINHLYDKDGRYIKSFAKRGEGPGEVKHQVFFFSINNKIIIPDGLKVHYFSAAGDLIESKNKKTMLAPDLFLNRDEFIFSTKSIHDAVNGKGVIKSYHLPGAKEKMLVEFDIFKGGTGKSDGVVFDMIVMGLTPLMTVCSGNNRLYYGISDNYHIDIIDLQGKKTGSFSVDRKPVPVSTTRKREHFKNSRLPQDGLNQIIKSLPGKLTYFQGIETHKGLVYVFVAGLGKSRDKQEIDIFSAEGKYMYRSCLRFGEGFSLMFSPFGNLRINGDFLYVVLESDAGDVLVRKYSISLPPGKSG
ncbi:MAG: hypothetical protein KAW12_16980 [Candidatus Aminicenantes bacterium]|nr:hypothetical protein [Candidatus Aminicenantes bacterium]